MNQSNLSEALMKWLLVLQVVVLLGLAGLFVDVNTIPGQTAGQFPDVPSDVSGPISDLQSSVDALTQEVSVLCSALNTTHVSSSPVPCPAP
jgi:hypothetical protein